MLNVNILAGFSTGKLRTILNRKVRGKYYSQTDFFQYLACKKNFYDIPCYRDFIIKILSKTPKKHPRGDISFNLFCDDFNNFIMNACSDKPLSNSFLLACSNIPFYDICESKDSYTIFHDKCQDILSSFYKAESFSFEQFSYRELENQIEVFESFHPLYAHKDWIKRDFSNDDSTAFVYSAIYIFCNARVHFSNDVCDKLIEMFSKLQEYHDEYKINDELDEEKLWLIFWQVFNGLISGW